MRILARVLLLLAPIAVGGLAACRSCPQSQVASGAPCRGTTCSAERVCVMDCR